uniref:Putative secreted protein n=1 Tax=Anopheles darlingi TaxID=43151 RepID=A0A2M4D3Z6_ANODA
MQIEVCCSVRCFFYLVLAIMFCVRHLSRPLSVRSIGFASEKHRPGTVVPIPFEYTHSLTGPKATLQHRTETRKSDRSCHTV